ncbi:hypothetical protein [Actinacidiphila sp. bgisy145]|uniref:hypothetical protein n=1 Tax=Actinacidiphila sp. bgisy145 TaxID=3413792 RepID=UPI003EB929B4
MTAKATRTKTAPAVIEQPTIESLLRFTPEEAFAQRLTTYKPSTLKKLAQRHQIRHHREGGVPTGRIYFTLADLAAITAAEQVAPLVLSA